ncbi:uncharacterized protein DUF1806 [Melghiribacillus thermohalophilus]|uniref:Uncharacterized protein DUF1806 n=1 Tax=Melghiribacillus thermohalophilus TaxID=1324956 RepID=A0A4V2V0V4_9BACI|nr:YojF family protein [Melghiribacillus thermohalophilus]TCT18762.1 uncharacterized protein DUF1806 [Melghiribacillus thermohalophilus]
MKPIQMKDVQKTFESFVNKDVYIHLETTNGAYARHFNQKSYNVGAYIRNAKVTFSRARIAGEDGFYRVGLKMDLGWIYAEGLTHWEVDGQGRLLMAGHDDAGRLMVALEISEKPFK